jgi:hypothetical protein
MTTNLLPEDTMSNGPKMVLGQGLQLVQRQTMGVYLAPLMTPVLRRSRDDRPEPTDDEDTPWRDGARARPAP